MEARRMAISPLRRRQQNSHHLRSMIWRYRPNIPRRHRHLSRSHLRPLSSWTSRRARTRTRPLAAPLAEHRTGIQPRCTFVQSLNSSHPGKPPPIPTRPARNPLPQDPSHLLDSKSSLLFLASRKQSNDVQIVHRRDEQAIVTRMALQLDDEDRKIGPMEIVPPGLETVIERHRLPEAEVSLRPLLRVLAVCGGVEVS